MVLLKTLPPSTSDWGRPTDWHQPSAPCRCGLASSLEVLPKEPIGRPWAGSQMSSKRGPLTLLPAKEHFVSLCSAASLRHCCIASCRVVFDELFMRVYNYQRG